MAMLRLPLNLFHKATLYALGVLTLSACTISPLKSNKELVDQPISRKTIPEQFQANDSELNTLVAESLHNNPSIRIIAARRTQSEELINAAGGSQYPGINAIGNTGSKLGSNGAGLTGFYTGANWELDLWSRVRTSIAGATQNSKSINADQDAALAKSVWLARSLQEQAQLAKDNADASQKIADLTRVREKIGASSASDVAITKITAAQAQESALNSSLARDQALRAVEILVGRYPKAEPLKTTELPALPKPVARQGCQQIY
jgi:outer membrane protein TolC